MDAGEHYRAKTARRWCGGHDLFREKFLRDFAAALSLNYSQFCTGQFPGTKETTMFKFPMGAAVVLTTSFRDAQAEASENDQQLHDEAAHAARSVYRAAGRRDLADGESAKATDSSWEVIGKLGTYRRPIEAGTVVARAEYAKSPPQYLVRYRGGDGRQTEAWFDDDALEFDPRVKSQPAEASVKDTAEDFAISPRV